MADDRRHDDDRRVTPKMVVGVILLVAVVAFAVDNRQDVRVGYVFGNAVTPLILVILVVLVIGAFVGYVAARRR